MSRKLIHLASLFAAGAVIAGTGPTLGARPVEPASTSLGARDLTGSCGSKDMKEDTKKDDAKKGDTKKEGKGKKKEMKQGSCGAGSCGSKDTKDKKGKMKDGSCGSKGKMDDKKDEKKN